jgi:Adenylate and Guanylate cyclase catalytic domain
VSDVFYPIIDELDRVNVAGFDDFDAVNHKTVGAIAASIYWRAIIRDILPPHSNGIQVVFINPCNNPFTYQINGPSVKYLGVGDKHDKKYDHLAVHSELTELNSYAIRDSVYSGAPLDEEFCPFTLHVYPSDEMKSGYTTKDPIIFTVAAVLIFVFSALVFCLYDYSVERRQKLVLNTAVRSSAIVSSLFPSAVRDRLYPEGHDTGAKKNKRNACRPETAKGKLQSFLRDGKTSPGGEGFTPLTNSPIAELYPDTTVIFADIAGFTAWSSVRQPTQVFHLLETLYGAFDEIAKRRGVFKVETIGDSCKCSAFYLVWTATLPC